MSILGCLEACPQFQLSSRDFPCLLNGHLRVTQKSMSYYTHYLHSGQVPTAGTASQVAMFQMKLTTCLIWSVSNDKISQLSYKTSINVKAWQETLDFEIFYFPINVLVETSPSSFLCRSEFLKPFRTCLTIRQTHHFATLHLCWCNNTVVQIRVWLSVFIWLNHFEAGAKGFWTLEPDL